VFLFWFLASAWIIFCLIFGANLERQNRAWERERDEAIARRREEWRRNPRRPDREPDSRPEDKRFVRVVGGKVIFPQIEN
jgi:hypothetical protein